MEILKELYKNFSNVKVISATGATVDVALLHNCKAIIRGIRSLTDFDYEHGMAEINRDLSSDQVNTICLFADKEHQFVSSTVVKEVFSLNKDISKYVVQLVQEKMLEKRNKND